MKKVLIYIFLFFLNSILLSQSNIIPNGGFETYTACPSNYNTGFPDELTKVTGWSSCNITADYFNTCSTNAIVGVPNNIFGYRMPASGNVYVGLWAYYAGSFQIREVITAQLTNSLSIGSKYFVKFKASLAEGDGSDCGVNRLGLRFSTVGHSTVTPAPINNFAHVTSGSFITDTINWVNISSSFIADSNYKFVEIGNFFSDANTPVQVVKTGASNKSYYFIDDVCVSTDSLFTNSWSGSTSTGTYGNSFNKFISQVSPNPGNGTFKINIGIPIDKGELIIFNCLGQRILVQKIQEGSNEINIKETPSGIYNYSIQENKTQIQTGKIVIE